MQEILDRYKTGILISKVTMQNAQPPEQVQAAFDDAVKASQDRERQKNEGQAYANDVIPKARGTAARLLEEAEGYKQRLIATAEGDASRFKQINAEYAKSPEVTRSRMYLETLQQVYSNTSKVLVDSKGSGKPALSAARQVDAGRRFGRGQRRRQSRDGCRGATVGGNFQRGAATGGREDRSTFAREPAAA
jgi:HflK protein